MFRQILVPVDLTEKNRTAVDVAAGLWQAAGAGARLTLLHVIETIDHVPFEELEDFYAMLQRKAEAGLEELAGRLPEAGGGGSGGGGTGGTGDEGTGSEGTGAGADGSDTSGATPAEVRRRVVYGHRARAIVDFAGQQGCDLIVLSSHRVDPERRGEDWATLSHKVAILSPCPVLLVK